MYIIVILTIKSSYSQTASHHHGRLLNVLILLFADCLLLLNRIFVFFLCGTTFHLHLPHLSDILLEFLLFMCLLLHISGGHLLFEWQSQLGHGGCRCVHLCIELVKGHGCRGLLLLLWKVVQDEGIKSL